MNLFIWLVAMFLLGLVAMGLCYLFLIGCEKI
jgi:VIT1/CCC1 family predicted Fe2+/Mn2+ transporter